MAVSETARLITALELVDKFSKPIDAAGRSLGKFETRAKRLDQLGFHIGRGLGNAAHNISLLGIAAGGLVVAGLTASVNAASDLNESINKVDVVFGKLSGKVHAFGQTSAAALGLSRQQAEESASSFGNLFKVVGLTDEASADMSIRLVTLAGDIASFNNIDPAEALEKLRSGLIGEAEPLRSVGVLLTEATVQEEAYASGIAERGKKLTEGQKVQARYNLILKQTTTAQGDFARTSTGLANQQRILRASLTDTAAVIGTALLPTVNKLLLKFTTLLHDRQPDIQRFADSLPGIADRVGAVLGGLPWATIGEAFKVMGSGAKLALEAFESAPPWLQTAVLTGWGLNKLTGGALGNIALDIGKLAFSRGSTPANPLFVSQVGGVGGPDGVVPGGGGFLGFLGKLGLGALAIGGGAAVGNAIARPIFDKTVAPAVKFEQSQFDKFIKTIDQDELNRGLDVLNLNIKDLQGESFIGDLIAGDQLKVLRDQRDIIKGKLAAIQNAAHLDALRAVAQQAEREAGRRADAARTLDTLRGQANTLMRIETKPTPDINVAVDVTTNVSVSNLERTLISNRIAGSGTIGGFTESAF